MAKPGSKKRTVIFILEIIVLVVLIGGLYAYGQIDSRLDKLDTPQLDETRVVTNETAPQMTGYTTYALFGIDHRSKNAALDTQNSDTIIIASVNNDTKEVKLVSVYRDTLLDIGKDTYTKANAAYAYGGPEQAMSMLNTMLDLNITKYATVDFNAMVVAIDALGGLDIPLSYAEIVFMNDYCIETSEETGRSYTPVELPDPKPEDEEAILGTYHLNGVQAVSYCRIRYTASMDMGRTERQRRVIQMMVSKAKTAGLSTIFEIMDEVFPLVTTCMTKTEILQMIPSLIGYSVDETIGFPIQYKFADVKSSSVIVADTLESNVIQLHEFLYGESDYEPSQNIVEASAKIIQIVGGEDTLLEQAPVVENDTDDTTGDVVWQGDGSGNYNYTDYSSGETDTGYNSWDDNSYDSGYDSGGGSGDSSGSDEGYDSGNGSGDNSGYDSGNDTWYDPGDDSGDDSWTDSGTETGGDGQEGSFGDASGYSGSTEGNSGETSFEGGA